MIRLNNLIKLYRRNVVLDNVSVSIPDKKITFLMGKNGSGKTTLLKVILALENYQGDVLFSQKKIDEIYGQISVVYDDAPLYPNLTGYQNIKILTNESFSEDKANEIALELLTEETLRKKVKKYSYGQRKKLTIIIALLNKPKYLLMDEVSNGLDYETMKRLKIFLKEQKETALVLLTGHQFEFYDEIVDQVLLLNNKKLAVIDIEGEAYQDTKLEQLYEKNL